MRLLICLCASLTLAACQSGSDDETAEQAERPALPESEIERGLEACDAYVERLCACAEERSDLADRCHMAGSKPKTLQMLLDAARHEDADPADVTKILDTFRKNVAVCMEGVNEIAKLCPP